MTMYNHIIRIYFSSSCWLEIPVRWCSSQQNSFPNSYTINKCLASYYGLCFTSAIWQSFFYISR